MGCLTVCRWCCCCFLSVVNILYGILGLAFLVTGCFAAWGYAVVREAMHKYAKDFAGKFERANLEATVDVNSIHKGFETLFASLAAVLLIAGLLLVIISCLGCCGACFGVPGCLITYVVIIGLLILTDITMVIIWFADRNILKSCSRRSLESMVKGYRGTQNLDMQTIQMDVLQMSLGCCGVNNGNDYYKMGDSWNRTVGVKNKATNRITYHNASYPFSCCQFDRNGNLTNEKCSYSNVTYGTNYNVGCYEKIEMFIDSNIKLDNLVYSLASSIFFELLLIAGALVIYCHKKKEQDDIPHSGVQYKMQPQMA